MTTLYLLALLPPEPVFSQVWALKQELNQLTGSRNAVRLPPHITLIPPTPQPEEFEAACIAGLTDFAATQPHFRVGVEGFAWFGSRTLFVRLREAEALQAFHAALTAWCAAHLPAIPRESRPFTPHMTLATRDLPPAQVPTLKQLFANRAYAADFEVADFTLFRHDGRQWVARATFALAG
jgi:2'-5' RNA ligase